MKDAKQLHEEVAGLERRKADLARQLEEQSAENEKHREQLRLLQGGLFHGPRRRWVWVMALVVVVAAAVGYLVYGVLVAKNRRGIRPVVSVPLRPHVLITSEPAQARVTFTSNRVPGSVSRKGRGTPFYFDAPPRGASYTITVEAPGYRPQTRTLQAKPRAGVHWHAVLEPSGGER